MRREYTILCIFIFLFLCVITTTVFSQERSRGLVIIEDPETGRLIQPYNDRWAIIIGIDNYEHAPRLDYAATDAEAIHRIVGRTFRVT